MWQRFSLVSHLKIKFAIMIQVFTFQKAKCKKEREGTAYTASLKVQLFMFMADRSVN